MNLNELLIELSDLGIKLWFDGDQLRIRAPKGVLTPSQRDQLATHKEEVILLLQQSKFGATAIPLLPVPRTDHLPISFEQERLWVLAQVVPASAHNIGQAFKLIGELNIAVLERSLDEIVRRHESLRTIFKIVEGKPVQIIIPHESIQLRVQDLQHLEADERLQSLWQIAAEERQYPFDLISEPLWRFKLIRIGESEYVLTVILHHIISDALSLSLVFQELTILYEAFYRGKPSPLPEFTIQYGDFTVWQRQWMASGVLENHLVYWRKQLEGASFELKLPTDRSRPVFQSFQGRHHVFKLSEKQWLALQNLSYQQQAVTPFMTLLAIFKVLLYRCSTQEDILISVSNSGRIHPKVEQLIGFFGYPLLIRNQIAGDLQFQELLSRVRQVVVDAYAHQNVPFGKLVEIVGSKRNKSDKQSFRSILNGFNLIGKQLMTLKQLPNLTIAPIEGTMWAPADLDMYLSMYEVDAGVIGSLEYNPDIFDADTIEAFADSYCLLVEQCIQSVETKVVEFKLSENLEAKIKASRLREQKTTLAIAATFTAEPIADSLTFWMQQLHLPFHIEFAPYNQVFQQLLDPTSLLAQNQQGINIVLVRFEDWARFENSVIAFHQKIEQNAQDLVLALKAAAARTAVPYLVCLCPSAPETIADVDRALFIEQMEAQLVAELGQVSGVYLLTTAELVSNYSVRTFYDPRSDQLGHIPFTPLCFTALGTLLARKISALQQNPYKVIVLDCDQTLWQGVCGEDGVDGIVLDPSHQALQEFMVSQHNSGMLLCLCSKNNEEDVLQVFDRRSEMRLRREHFVSWRINWQPKSENLKSLSQELKLGLDSFIFIDDNPIDCAEVQAYCPEVLTLQLPEDPNQIPTFLNHIWAFDRQKTTAEDKQRTVLYQQNLQREQARQESLTLRDFLNSLNLQVQITESAPSQLERISQLTLRTNQFNATTIRRSVGEIQTLWQSGKYTCLVVEVRDRFGDYGLVGTTIFSTTADTLEVDTFLLSCRALGRGVEHQMLAKLGEIAVERQLQHVNVTYKPTPKNQPILDFLDSVGSGFKEQLTEGYSFKFAADFCQAKALLTEGSTDDSELTKAPKLPVQQLTPTSGIRVNSALLQRIATQLYDPEQIFQAMESQQLQPEGQQQPFVAPRTETEKQVANLWAKLLHIDTVGIHNNFFDLGGTSLLAVQLMSGVWETFSVEVPLDRLLQYPTVAGIAQVIDFTRQTEATTANTKNSSLDLNAEVVLDPAICLNTIPHTLLTEPASILLTGATGFLGAYILDELLKQTPADIYCLIRSPNLEESKNRIKSNLENYSLWNEAFSDRIIPLPGELSEPRFGLKEQHFCHLASKIDVIYHNGAWVNFIYPYSALKAANVLGTQEILRLASQIKVKPVHFTSTLAVFSSEAYSGVKVIPETDLLDKSQGIEDGYTQSKWVAEKLVMEARDRGLPVCIYRPGLIAGDSKKGTWNTDDFFSRMIKSCIQLGIAPNLDVMVSLAPVDYIGKAIVHLSQQKESLGKAFHLVSHHPISWRHLFNLIGSLGYPIEQISSEKWRTELIHQAKHASENALHPFLPLFSKQMPLKKIGAQFDCQNTLAGLAGTDIICPTIDKELLGIYFSYFRSSGFLEELA